MTNQPSTAPSKPKLNLLQVTGIIVLATLALIGALFALSKCSSDDEAPAQPTRAQQALLNAGFIDPHLVETAEQVAARNLKDMSVDLVRDTYTVNLGACKGVKVTLVGDVVIWRDLYNARALQIQDNARSWGVEHCFTQSQAAPTTK